MEEKPRGHMRNWLLSLGAQNFKHMQLPPLPPFITHYLQYTFNGQIFGAYLKGNPQCKIWWGCYTHLPSMYLLLWGQRDRIFPVILRGARNGHLHIPLLPCTMEELGMPILPLLVRFPSWEALCKKGSNCSASQWPCNLLNHDTSDFFLSQIIFVSKLK